MIQFNSKGLLTPATHIETSLEEFKKHFVEAIPSKTRSGNFEKYIKYSDALKQLLRGKLMRQWINGSFVTQLPNPRDIDMITFVDFQTIAQLGNLLDKFRAREAWSTFGVDAYILEVYPADHDKNFFYKSDTAYWMSRFDTTRRDFKGNKYPKVFLEIIY